MPPILPWGASDSSSWAWRGLLGPLHKSRLSTPVLLTFPSWSWEAEPLGGALFRQVWLLYRGRQPLVHCQARPVLSKPMFCLYAVKYIVRRQAVAFGLQLGAWQRFLPDEVRGEAKDARCWFAAGNIFPRPFGQVVNVLSKERACWGL